MCIVLPWEPQFSDAEGYLFPFASGHINTLIVPQQVIHTLTEWWSSHRHLDWCLDAWSRLLQSPFYTAAANRTQIIKLISLSYLSWETFNQYIYFTLIWPKKRNWFLWIIHNGTVSEFRIMFKYAAVSSLKFNVQMSSYKLRAGIQRALSRWVIFCQCLSCLICRNVAL